MKVIKALFLIVLLLFGCKQEKIPDDIIDQKKMILIMADLHTMDGYMSTIIYNDTTRKNSKNLYATIYKTHNTTAALYEKSLKYYSMKPALLDTMYNSVQAILDEKEHKLNRAEIKKTNRIQKQK
jgi:hypothetical protein